MSNIVKDLIYKEDIEYSSDLGEYQKEKMIDDKVSQLNQDPTVAIISNNVSSDEELLRLYNKYSMLPKMFKRISNQYSIQLFGYNVPNMFAIMRDKLIDNNDIFEESNILNERLINDVPDLYYNKRAFDNGEINLCFVIGYSGSGKSTLVKGKEYSKVEVIELDNLVCTKDNFSMNDLKEQSELLFSFFNKPGKKYYVTKEERDNKVYKNIFKEFIEYAKKYAASHKDKKFVLEGIWTYIFYDDPSEFDSYAVFIKGTSLIKSKIRRMKRELKNNIPTSIKRLEEFGVYLTDSMLNENKIDKWYEYFEKRPETILDTEVKIESTINLAVINNDESLLESIDTSEFSIQEKAMLDYEFNEAKKEIQENKYYDFSDYSLTPWFTLDEEYCKLEFFEDPDYSKKVIQAMREYKYNPSLENCTKVLDLGWNPCVELTKESIEYAKKRQTEYLKEHQAVIYDLTKNNIDVVTESTKQMRAFYNKMNIYPVYIVLSWTNTTFGKIIRFVKDSKYSHAGMTLDSDLREIVTFKYDGLTNGFEIENLKGYINTYADCQIEVLCLFVDKTILNKMRKSINYYKTHNDITKYGFKNLINILFNRKKEFTAFDTEMVCSQFVDHILKLCDIDVTGKANNLVIPQDYATIVSKNPKVYRIFEGYGKEYSDIKSESVIKDLIKRNGGKIRYKEEAYDLNENIEIPLELAIYSVEK